MSKRKKGMVSDALALTTTGITLGVGANIISKVGGSTAGIASLSSFMPMIGTVKGAGYAIDALGELRIKKRRRRH